MGVLILFFVVAGFYFYYWFGLRSVQKMEVVCPEISFQPDEEAEDIESSVPYEENVSDEDLIEAQILENQLDIKDIQYLPDVQSIPHISSILKLSPKENMTNKQEVSADSEKLAKIAIVVDDMGASPMRTNEIIAIRAPLTSSFVTFASQLKKQTEQARQAGHELMIHVPMQPKSDIFVSDDVLTIDMASEQIEKNFAHMLGKFKNVVGVNNHMGSLFTEHGDKLVPIMKLLAKHHLFFLDSKTTPQSQGEKIARQYHVANVHRHVFLDNENNLEYILRQLEKAEKIAHQNGYAIAIGHPKTQTSKALMAWLKTLSQKKLKLVHLSEIVKEVTTQQ